MIAAFVENFIFDFRDVIFTILCVVVCRILMFEVSISLQTSYIGRCWNWWTLTGQAKIMKTVVADFISCLDLLAMCQVQDAIS